MDHEKEFRVDRFTFQPGDAEVIFYEDQLKAEFDKNLSAMENPELSNEKFLQLSERNIEIQREIIRIKQQN